MSRAAGDEAHSRVDERGGILRIVFDRPGDKVNLLTREILRGPGAALHGDPAAGTRSPGSCFTSAKPGMFIAGMDVEEIAALVTDPFAAAEGARCGQTVFQQIADLPVPSVAAIGGACLGAGRELALACTMRVAADDPAVVARPARGAARDHPRLRRHAAPAAPGRPAGGARPDPDRPRARREACLARRARRPGRSRPPTSSARRSRCWRRRRPRVGASRAGCGARVRLLERIMEATPPAPSARCSGRREKATEARVRRPTIPRRSAPSRPSRPPSTPAPARGARHRGAHRRRADPHAPPARTSSGSSRARRALKKDAGVQRRAPQGEARGGPGGRDHGRRDRPARWPTAGIPVRLKDVRQDALLTALRHADGLWRKQVAKAPSDVRASTQQRLGFISPTLDDTRLLATWTS